MTDAVNRTLSAFMGMFVTLAVMVFMGKAPSLSIAFAWLEEV